MNISFGSAFNPTALGNTLESEARTNVSAPTQAEQQDTTSFTSISESSKSDASSQDATREKLEARQLLDGQRRLNRQAEKNIERAQQQDLQFQQRQQNDQVAQSRVDEDRKQEAKRLSRLEQEIEQAKLMQIRELADRDREVRAHEQAHQAVGGKYAGAASYDYERGPDGRNYAVSGEVPIKIRSDPNDPAATLEQANVVRRAALAPAEPSSRDLRVAAQATQVALEAQSQVQELHREELQTNEAHEDEDNEAKAISEEELKDEEDTTSAQLENVSERDTIDLQELNQQLSKIQAELHEISQFDEKVNASVNLLDASV